MTLSPDDIRQAILANQTSDFPLTVMKLARALKVRHPSLYTVARACGLSVSAPVKAPLAGTRPVMRYVGKTDSVRITTAMLRRAGLERADHVAYAIDPATHTITIRRV